MEGQFTFRAVGCLRVASSHVHPSIIITEDCPGILPDDGAELMTKTPLERVTGMRSESGL